MLVSWMRCHSSRGQIINIMVGVDTGIIAKDIQPAQFFLHRFHHGRNLCLFADIGANHDGSAVLGAHIFRHLLRLFP